MGTRKSAARGKKEREEEDSLFSYFKLFMKDKAVASITPSSKYLVKRVVKAMAARRARVVIEYGAADGVMTRRILERMPEDGRLLAVELNKKLYRALEKNVDPRAVFVRGDVRQIGSIARERGIEQADAIVSGIPFAFLSGRERHELLLKTHEMLRPGGRFVAYQVTTHLIPLLKDYFRKVDTQFELRNLPPHFVFTAYK